MADFQISTPDHARHVSGEKRFFSPHKVVFGLLEKTFFELPAYTLILSNRPRIVESIQHILLDLAKLKGETAFECHLFRFPYRIKQIESHKI